MTCEQKALSTMSAAKAVDWVLGRLDYAHSDELCAVLRRIEEEWDAAEDDARYLERAHNVMPDAADLAWQRAGEYEDAHARVTRARELIAQALKEMDHALAGLLRAEQ